MMNGFPAMKGVRMVYNVIPIMDGVWTIEDGNVRMYLVDGG